MFTMIPVYDSFEMFFYYCDLCPLRVSREQALIDHYKRDHKMNKQLLFKIRDNKIRKALSLPELKSNNIKCEICNLEMDEREEMYLVHLLEYHRPEDIVTYVKNERLLDILTDSNILSITCEFCQEVLTTESSRQEYLKHIFSKHSAELEDCTVYKKIKNIKVLWEVLKNTNRRTKVEDDSESVLGSLINEDDFFRNLNQKIKEEEAPITVKCDVCLIQIENSIEIYLSHVLESHNFTAISFLENSKIKSVLVEMKCLNFSCEICNSSIGPLDNKYTDHLLNFHSDLGISMINVVKDKFFFTQAIRKILQTENLKSREDSYVSEISLFSNSKSINSLNSESKDLTRRICEVCNEDVEVSYEMYAIHLSNHPLQEVKSKVFVPNVIYILTLGVMTPIRCEICFNILSEDVEDYIKHLKQYHMNQLNTTLSNQIADKYIASTLFGNKKLNTQTSSSYSVQSSNSLSSGILTPSTPSSHSFSLEEIQRKVKYYLQLPPSQMLEKKEEISKLIEFALNNYPSDGESRTNELSNENSKKISTSDKVDSSNKINESNLYSHSNEEGEKESKLLLEKTEMLKKLKSLDDSIFEEEIINLEKEINLVSNKLNHEVKLENSLNEGSNENQDSSEDQNKNKKLKEKVEELNKLKFLNDSLYEEQIEELEKEIEQLK